MTTTPQTPVPSVEDYTHPEWCDLALCRPSRSIVGSHPEGSHESTGTTWGVQSDEAEFSVSLARHDDRVGEVNHGVARLRVSLRNDAFGSLADAWVDPDDARMLAAILTRYAERAERRGLDFPAEDLPACRN